MSDIERLAESVARVKLRQATYDGKIPEDSPLRLQDNKLYDERMAKLRAEIAANGCPFSEEELAQRATVALTEDSTVDEGLRVLAAATLLEALSES